MKRNDATPLAILVLGGVIIWQMIKKPAKAEIPTPSTELPAEIPTCPTGPPAEKPYRPMGYLIPKPARLIPLPISGPLFYLPPGEIPTDYTQRIRKSYYDDLWNRGGLRWQQAANTFWGATEKATEYSDIYPHYMEAYDMAVTQ